MKRGDKLTTPNLKIKSNLHAEKITENMQKLLTKILFEIRREIICLRHISLPWTQTMRIISRALEFSCNICTLKNKIENNYT